MHYGDALDWYSDAALTADALACGTPYTREQTAGVLAVLSPRVSWKVNKRLAYKVVAAHLDGVPVSELTGGLRSGLERAYRVLDGDLDAISGPKVTAFWRAILGDKDALTLDVWAFRAAIGRDYVGAGPVRRDVVESYRNGARIAGESVRDFQAIVWVAVRGSAL